MLIPQSQKRTVPRQGFFEITYRVKDAGNDLALHCLEAQSFVSAMTRFMTLEMGTAAHIREIPAKEFKAWQEAQAKQAEAAASEPTEAPQASEAQP